MDTQKKFSLVRFNFNRIARVRRAEISHNPRLSVRLFINLLTFALLLVQLNLFFSAFARTPVPRASQALQTPQGTGGSTDLSSNMQRLEDEAAKMVRTAEADRHFAELAVRTDEEVKHPYLIRLRLPYQPEGTFKAPVEIEAQREMIVRVRQRLLDRLKGYDQTSIKSFKYIPYLGLRVSQAGFESLRSSPFALDIQEDTVSFPSQSSGGAAVGAGQVLESGPTGSGKAIAFLDTGIDKAHSYLSGRVVAEACYSSNIPLSGISSLCPAQHERSESVNSGIPCEVDGADCDHGTHVAGIAAGEKVPGRNFSGVAPEANLISIQVASRLDSETGCASGNSSCLVSFTSDQLAALERVYELRAAHQIVAVNIGFSGGSYKKICDDAEPAYRSGIDLLRSVDIATIAPAGNNGDIDALGAPACISSAISVGSTREPSGQPIQVASFSNSAKFLNLLAPGDSINSAVSGGSYALGTGTSMSSSQVAGAWALLRQVSNVRDVKAILAALTESGTPVIDSRNGITIPRLNIEGSLARLNTLATLSTAPNRPSNLIANTFSSNQINLKWTDNSSNEMGSLIFMKLASDPCQQWEVLDPDPKVKKENKKCVPLVAYDLVPENISLHKVYELESETSYIFYIVAYNLYGHSIGSNVVTAKTLKPPIVPPTELSASATKVNVTTISATTKLGVTLNWKDNSNNEFGFKVMRRLSSSGVWTRVADVIQNPCSSNALTSLRTDRVCYSNESLPPDTEYVYQVHAYNMTTDSIKSNEVKVITLGATQAPAAPTELTVNAVPVKYRPKMAEIRWKDIAGNEAGYRIKRRELLSTGKFSEWVEVTTLAPGSESLVNSGLVPGNRYEYYLEAFNSIGTTQSQVISFIAPLYNFTELMDCHTTPNDKLGCPGSLLRDEKIYYRVKVPPPPKPNEPLPKPVTKLIVRSSGKTGITADDVDIFVRAGQQPTTDDFNCASGTKGPNEVCEINNPAPGDWYIMVKGYSWMKTNYRLLVQMFDKDGNMVILP